MRNNFNMLVHKLLTEANVYNIDELIFFALSHFKFSDDLFLKIWFVKRLKKYVADNDLWLQPYKGPIPQGWNTNSAKDLTIFDPNSPLPIEGFLQRSNEAIRDFTALYPSQYSQKLPSMSLEDVEEVIENSLIEDKDVHTVMTFDNNTRWVKLLSSKAFHYHGVRQGHCMSSEFYDKYLENNPEALKPNTATGSFGLYKSSQAKVTLEIDQDNEITDIAAHSKKYNPYILELLKRFKSTPGVYGGLGVDILEGWKPYEDYLDSVGFDRNKERKITPGVYVDVEDMF